MKDMDSACLRHSESSSLENMQRTLSLPSSFYPALAVGTHFLLGTIHRSETKDTQWSGQVALRFLFTYNVICVAIAAFTVCREGDVLSESRDAEEMDGEIRDGQTTVYECNLLPVDWL